MQYQRKEAGVKSTNRYEKLNELGNDNEELKEGEASKDSIEDVLEGTSGITKEVVADVVLGMDNTVLH